MVDVNMRFELGGPAVSLHSAANLESFNGDKSHGTSDAFLRFHFFKDSRYYCPVCILQSGGMYRSLFNISYIWELLQLHMGLLWFLAGVCQSLWQATFAGSSIL